MHGTWFFFTGLQRIGGSRASRIVSAAWKLVFYLDILATLRRQPKILQDPYDYWTLKLYSSVHGTGPDYKSGLKYGGSLYPLDLLLRRKYRVKLQNAPEDADEVNKKQIVTGRSTPALQRLL